MIDETLHALHDWADKIAALEPEVVDGVVSSSKRLAGDNRLRQADRDFAQAQVDAIRRAARRAKSSRKKP